MTRANVADGFLADVVLGGQSNDCAFRQTKATSLESDVLRTDGLSGGRSQFDTRIPLAAEVCTVMSLIKLILSRRPPLQVFKTVVCWIAVGKVTGFHPWRAWADKRQQNKSVNPVHSLPARRMQANAEVAARNTRSLGALLRLQTPPLVGEDNAATYPATRPHRAVAANAVARVTWKVSVLDCSFGLSHDVDPLPGSRVVRADRQLALAAGSLHYKEGAF
jgi:hypothetical protein